jgi:hypothetical protein
MNPTILLVLAGCLFAGMNAGYYLVKLLLPSANTSSGSFVIGMLLGAMLGVILLSKPVMKFVVRSLQNRQRVGLKLLSLAGIVLLLAILAALNCKPLK